MDEEDYGWYLSNKVESNHHNVPVPALAMDYLPLVKPKPYKKNPAQKSAAEILQELKKQKPVAWLDGKPLYEKNGITYDEHGNDVNVKPKNSWNGDAFYSFTDDAHVVKFLQEIRDMWGGPKSHVSAVHGGTNQIDVLIKFFGGTPVKNPKKKSAPLPSKPELKEIIAEYLDEYGIGDPNAWESHADNLAGRIKKHA